MKSSYYLAAIFSLSVSNTILATDIDIYKSPSCGCCEKWADAMQENHQINILDSNHLAQVKQDALLPPELASCHTAFADNYVIEGHVPASAVDWLLETKPSNIIGISVPGMPADSLGMENHRRQDEYIVYGFDADGNIEKLFKYKSDILLEDYTKS